MPFGNLLPPIYYKTMKKLFFSLSFITLLLVGFPAQAGLLAPEFKQNIDSNTSQFNSAAGYDEGTNLLGVAKTVITIILGLLATIFLFLLVYSGFKWMTAAGDADDIKKAKATIRMAIIGLIIILSSYGITYFVFNQLNFFSGVAPVPSEQNSPNLGSG